MKVIETIDSLTKLRTITVNNVSSVVGEEITFYCPQCEKRKFVTVPPDGVIVCPDCGFEPDLSPKAKSVFLSQGSRLKLISDLFQPGGEADEYYIDVYEQYSDFIDAVYARTLSERVLHKVFTKKFQPLQDAADWLLAGKSKTPVDCNCYDDEGLARKLTGRLKSGAVIRMKSFTQIEGKLSKEPDMSTVEAVEQLALKSKYLEPFIDKGYEEVEILSCVSNSVDKEIVRLLMCGDGKTDVARQLGLTLQQLETRLKRIGNEMLYGPKQKSNIVKICRSCGEAKSIDDFGKDLRRKDGLQGICKACDAKRKKKVINFTGESLKIAC